MLTKTQFDLLDRLSDTIISPVYIHADQYQGSEKARMEMMEKQGLVKMAYHLTSKGEQALDTFRREHG